MADIGKDGLDTGVLKLLSVFLSTSDSFAAGGMFSAALSTRPTNMILFENGFAVESGTTISALIQVTDSVWQRFSLRNSPLWTCDVSNQGRAKVEPF